MALPLLAAGLMAGGSIAGGLMQNRSANKAAKRAEQMAREAAGSFDNLYVPTAAELEIQLQKLIQAGEITPEEAQAALVENSAYSGIDTTNQGTEAEFAALEELSNIVENKGMTAQDQAKLAEIEERLGTTGRGAREAILQDASARGIGGSGLELAAQLSAQQGAISDASRSGTQAAADSERRMLEAILAQGELGGNIDQKGFEKQARIAEAEDAIAKFNAANKQQVGLTNVGSRNRAQEMNLAEKQRIADANASMENQNRLRNSDLRQTQFENEMEKRKARAAALSGGAQTALQRSQSQNQFAGNLIGVGGQLLGNTAGYYDQKKKEG